MPLKELFWEYLHSPRLLEDILEQSPDCRVEGLLKALNYAPETWETLLMSYFEDYKELKANCEKILVNAYNPF